MGFWDRVTGRTTYDTPVVKATPPEPPAGPATPEDTATSQRGDSPSRVDPVETSSSQSDERPAPDEQPEPVDATPSLSTYTVQLGDLLDEIATRHGVPTRALIDTNGLQDPDRIYPGMQLRVPVS